MYSCSMEIPHHDSVTTIPPCLTAASQCYGHTHIAIIG
jgi:hypothetical protein